MNTAKNKDIKWFNCLQLDDVERPKYVFAGVGPGGAFWVNPREFWFITEKFWDLAEDYPRPAVMIVRGVLYVNLLAVAELTTNESLRQEIRTFVATMVQVLPPKNYVNERTLGL